MELPTARMCSPMAGRLIRKMVLLRELPEKLRELRQLRYVWIIRNTAELFSTEVWYRAMAGLTG